MTAAHPFPDPDSITAAAAQWVARRDRGLTPAEEVEFNAWCAADPRHRDALRRQYEMWGSLDLLQDIRPAGGAPDPDLLAPPVRRRRHVLIPLLATATLAAAAVLAFWLPPAPPVAPATAPAPEQTAAVRVIPGGEARTLSDGTVVVLDQDAQIQPDFTPARRTVRLVSGEAHFTVRHDPERPFVVVVGSVYVRDVSTAFAVRRGHDSVRVLVTQGQVFVGRPAGAKSAVIAGQRADVDTRRAGAAPVITSLSGAEMERLLAWRHDQLQFHDLPLSAVVAEFNRHNRTQVILGDASVGTLRVAGQFRADNVEAFVRLLQQSFGVSAESDGNRIILRPATAP